MGERTWSAQRDETQYLDNFEKAAYEMTRKVFLTPMHTFATLDDDLYGTRAGDNQVKTLSIRKADREGHTADAIADALFRITLAVRFRRRGEQQSANVLRLISTLIEGRGEQCLHGLLLTADRGYGSIALIRTLLRHGIGSIVMPQHLLRCHPFVGRSFLRITRHDENEDESDLDEVSDKEDDNGAVRDNDDLEESSSETEICEANEPLSSRNSAPDARRTELDRRRKFVVNEFPDAGPASFFAVKSVTSSGGGRSGRSDVTAVAVREHGTKYFSNVLRFMYSVPSVMARSLETWIAVPRTETVVHMLFSKRDDSGRIVTPSPTSSSEKDVVERLLLQKCTVLTIGQRCADWFILRQLELREQSPGKFSSQTAKFVSALVCSHDPLLMRSARPRG
jgi:hypothetical protein